MEQTVIERTFYQEQRISHIRTWPHDAADRIDTNFQQDPYQSGDSRRWIRQDRRNMYSCSEAGEDREFLSGRSYQGLRYLHSEFTDSERSIRYRNEHQRHEVDTASRSPESRAGYVDNYYRTLEFSRFHTDNPHKHAQSPEQLPRIAEASCNYGLGDRHSASPSRNCDLVNPNDYERTVSFPVEPITRGSRYERMRYDLDRRHHRGNVVREERFHRGRPPQDVYVSSVPSSYVRVRAYQKGWTAKRQFDRGRDVASGSRSSKRKNCEPASYSGDDQFEPEVNFTMRRRRKERFSCARDVVSRSRTSERERSRPASNLRGNKRKPQVCLKFTKGKCLKGSKCSYLHSFHDKKPITKTNSKKSRLAHRSRSSKSSVRSMTEEATDISSQRLPVSSMGATSVDHENVTKLIMNTYTTPEKDTLDGVNINLNRELNENCENTKPIVKTKSKIKGRVCKSKSSKRGVGSVTEAVTALDHKNVVSVSGVPDDLSTRVPQTDVIKAVLADGHPVESDLSSSLRKCKMSPPASTMLVVLEKVENPEETKGLQKTTVGVLENNEIAVVNNEVNEKSEGRKLVVKKAKTRRCRYSSSTSDVKPMTEEMTGSSSRILTVSSVIGTSLDHENVAMPVSGITDVVSTMDFPRTATALEKDELAGVTNDLNHEVNEKLEETKHLVKTNSNTRKIEQPEERKPLLNTSEVVLEKDEMAGIDTDLNHEMNDTPEEINYIVNTYTRRNLRDSASKCGEESVTEQVTNTPSLRLQTDSTGRIPLDNESVMPVSVVTDGISAAVPMSDVSRPVLANHHLFEEQENRETIEALNNVEQFSAVPEEGTRKARRKLLVLDVNGLLADIVTDFPHKFTPDFKLEGKGVFKRPFCDDFLNFCFENFDVGIWSSRNKINLTRTVEFLMRNTTGKLLFCWDKSHCTETGYNKLENFDKPLVIKELAKLWEKKDRYLPWQRGFYNESNTILLDDSPYKALRNPPFTAVFPRCEDITPTRKDCHIGLSPSDGRGPAQHEFNTRPYSFENVEDTSLGPNGDIRLYLKRLAEAANVQRFIEANPFW